MAHKDFLNLNFGAICHIIEFEPYCISSTILRDIIKNNGDISKHVPKKVIDYIVRNNLYK
jgi:nicotinic acid mononucleotide adenylyltransferase